MKSPASAARLPPFALEDAPPLIEALCPAQKVSFEAQEKAKGQHWKANIGETLMGLASYWKGRKPLIPVRAIVRLWLPRSSVGASRDGGLARREPKISPAEIARRIDLAQPLRYFSASFKGDAEDTEEIEGAQLPLDLDDCPGLTIRWRRDIDEAEKLDLLARALATYPTYEERAGLCKRPEEMDQTALYAPI